MFFIRFYSYFIRILYSRLPLFPFFRQSGGQNLIPVQGPGSGYSGFDATTIFANAEANHEGSSGNGGGPGSGGGGGPGMSGVHTGTHTYGSIPAVSTTAVQLSGGGGKEMSTIPNTLSLQPQTDASVESLKRKAMEMNGINE